jgi:formylmethanofuran dehydrogenase subunit E
MANKTASKSTTSSSWWKERGKIMAMKSETAKPKKKVKTKKASKAETGQTYICEVCGCEMVCASDSAGEVVCCGEPMCIVI